MGLFISDRGRGLVKNRRWPAMRELETAREHGQKRSPLPRTTAPRAPAPKCTSRVCYLALSSSTSASHRRRRRLPLRRARRRRSSRALINDRSAYLFVTLAYLTTLSALIFPRRRFHPSHANTVINVSCAAASPAVSSRTRPVIGLQFSQGPNHGIRRGFLGIRTAYD